MSKPDISKELGNISDKFIILKDKLNNNEISESVVYTRLKGWNRHIGKLIESYSETDRPNTNLPAVMPVLLTPQEIMMKLDKYVYGQDDAKKVLSVSSYLHYKKKEIARIERNAGKETNFKKSNVLLVGSSGVGKTLLVSSLARALDVPILCVDITKYSAPGYVGLNLESIPTLLYHEAGNDLEKARRGIVFIDEIDKISGVDRESVNRADVQSGLLKLIEGNKYNVGYDRELDTSDILFICAGAFPEIDKISSKRLMKSKTTMGFQGDVNKDTKDLKIESEDIISYGMVAELVGRLPTIGRLKNLNEDDLVNIMLTIDSSDAAEYTKVCEYLDVKVIFTEEGARAIAKQALKMKTGARGLRSIIDNVFRSLMFKAPSETCINATVEINEKFVGVMLGDNNE